MLLSCLCLKGSCTQAGVLRPIRSPNLRRMSRQISRSRKPLQVGKAHRIIEELDHGQFGGPSFGPQTIELMSKALEGAETSLPGPASDQQLRLIAAKILKVAGDGERNPIRLKAAAMSALGSVAGNADEKPPAT